MSYAGRVTILAAFAGDTVGRCGPVRCVPEVDASRVEPIAGGLDSAELAVVFEALSSPVRLRLLSVLQAAHGHEACVCDLVDHVGLGQSTVSHHLAVLVASGLLRREQRGSWTWYALVPQRLEAVRQLFG